jgi:hypothetical protein
MEDAKGMDLSIKQDAKDMGPAIENLATVIYNSNRALDSASKTDSPEQIFKDVRTTDDKKDLRELLAFIEDNVKFLREKIEDQLIRIKAAEGTPHK